MSADGGLRHRAQAPKGGRPVDELRRPLLAGDEDGEERGGGGAPQAGRGEVAGGGAAHPTPRQHGGPPFEWLGLLRPLVASWAAWLARVARGALPALSRSSTSSGGVGAGLHTLTALQEERLGLLRRRLGVPFDGRDPAHQAGLRELWAAAYPERPLSGLVSEQVGGWGRPLGWGGVCGGGGVREGGGPRFEPRIERCA